MKIFVLCLFVVAFSFHASAQTASFAINYTNFTPQAQTAFQYAADRWGQLVVSPVPIKVNAYFFPFLPAGTLGVTFPNGRKNFPGAPLPDTWYATSLANAIAGTELNPDEADMDLYLSGADIWYYDTTGAVPASKYDLVSVAMHELCHGLGFLSLAKKDSVGSFGLLQPSDFGPIQTTFPWPNLDTLPSVYDRLLVRNNGQRLDTLPNPGTILGSALSNNNVYIDGAHAVAANNGVKPRVYAPTVFSLGSSILHLNESTYPTGNPNEMMTPNGAPGSANHDPGPITLGVLRDIGWNLNPALSVNTRSLPETPSAFPNPAGDFVFVSNLPSGVDVWHVRIMDLTGRVLINAILPPDWRIDVSGFTNGVYTATLRSEKATYQLRLVKQ